MIWYRIQLKIQIEEVNRERFPEGVWSFHALLRYTALDFPRPGIKLVSLELKLDSLPLDHQGSPNVIYFCTNQYDLLFFPINFRFC